ncbi:MAG: SH3 domain-containing protein, partial [Parachlamydiaceae bacterium]|nr:SH3 domain-containing protein [Parachlamydiaceae bacterium]
MSQNAKWILAILTVLSQSTTSLLIAENTISTDSQENQASAQPFEPFTGRITRNKVRLRLQPSLDGQILQEFVHDDLIMVVGDAEDFYAILPPKDSKAYVFRTFILDNKVEGNKVNVRLEPALESPVIAQLHSGDEIHGVVSPLNSKWLEIAPPVSTRFYVCKEYVEKIGSPAVMAQIEKRREEVNELLNRSYQVSQLEMQKNYEDMKLDHSIKGFKKIINEYSDFPDQAARAKELLANLQELLLQKKIEYLEAKATNHESTSSATQASQYQVDNVPIAPTPIDDDTHFALSATSQMNTSPNWNKVFDPSSMTPKMAAWISNERALYDAWASRTQNATPELFYLNQTTDTLTLTGILEPYARAVKNKPG